MPALLLNLLAAVPQAILIAWIARRLMQNDFGRFSVAIVSALWALCAVSALSMFFLGDTDITWDLSLMEARAISSWLPIPALSLPQLALVLLACVGAA